jgi:hypothetical protein
MKLKIHGIRLSLSSLAQLPLVGGFEAAARDAAIISQQLQILKPQKNHIPSGGLYEPEIGSAVLDP